MGTVFSFDIRTPGVGLGPVIDWLHQVDRRFSTFRSDSEISRLGRGETSLAQCHPDVREVLEIGHRAVDEGGGAFTMFPQGTLDPSAVVKGWSVERASRMLTAAGSKSHLINGGGDVQTFGRRSDGTPWRVAIVDPRNRDRILAVVAGENIAVATSGTAERGSHVIDGRSGQPATGLLSVTVAGFGGLTSVDIAATTAMALGDVAREWLAARSEVAALVVPGDGALVVPGDGASWRTNNWSDFGVATGE